MLQLYTLSCHYLEWPTIWIPPHISRMKLWKFPQFFLVKKGNMNHFKKSAFFRWKRLMNLAEMVRILWKSIFVCFPVQKKISCMFGDILEIFEPFFVESYLKTWNYQLAIGHKLSHLKRFHLEFPRYSGVICLSGWWFQFFYFHPEPWGTDPIWRAYFSNGLVQPKFNHQLVVSRKVKQRRFLCFVLVIAAHWDTTGGIFCDRTTEWRPIRIGFDFNKYPRYRVTIPRIDVQHVPLSSINRMWQLTNTIPVAQPTVKITKWTPLYRR